FRWISRWCDPCPSIGWTRLTGDRQEPKRGRPETASAIGVDRVWCDRPGSAALARGALDIETFPSGPAWEPSRWLANFRWKCTSFIRDGAERSCEDRPCFHSLGQRRDSESAVAAQ